MINSYVFMMFFVMKSVVKLLVFFVETAILILLPYQRTDHVADRIANISPYLHSIK